MFIFLTYVPILNTLSCVKLVDKTRKIRVNNSMTWWVII